MILISDTLNYRPDGTVSGVTRVMRDSYTTPSGREMTENVTSIVTLADVGKVLDPAYAAHDEHNKALEQQIIDERAAAATDKENALSAAASSAAEALASVTQQALAERNDFNTEIAQKNAVIAQQSAALEAATAAKQEPVV